MTNLADENTKLRQALEEILSTAECQQTFYDQNGPQWLASSGEENESTADVLAIHEGIAATARLALGKAAQ